MASSRDQRSVSSYFNAAIGLASSVEAQAVLFLLDSGLDWADLSVDSRTVPVVIASLQGEVVRAAEEAGLKTIRLEIPESPISDRLTQAILHAVSEEWIKPGASVVAVYSGFDSEGLDSISVIRLNERLGKLTARDLKKLETRVPLDTLKLVVDLAVDIGREGREGKPVGTAFIVGDHRRVLDESRTSVFDFVKGYPRRERNLSDPRVRECVKEIAQLDGAFVVASDGTVEASCRIIDTAPVELTMTTGLGSRHFSAAAISKNTEALAVTVSETSGTVRLFQNGEVVLRIEPFRRAMKWKSFHAESSPQPE